MSDKLYSMYRIIFHFPSGHFEHLSYRGKYYYRYYIDEIESYWYDYDFTEDVWQ